MADPLHKVEKVVARKAHVHWALSFWKTWSWLAFLIGAILTTLLWAASATCAPWFALGYLLALLVVAILCLFLWPPPPPPPPGTKRFRLINGDGKRHVKKLRLKLKMQPEAPGWDDPAKPWDREYDLGMFTLDPLGLAPGAHCDFESAPGAPLFGVYAEIGWEYPGSTVPAGTVAMNSSYEDVLECGTLCFKEPDLVFHPDVILEQCP